MEIDRTEPFIWVVGIPGSMRVGVMGMDNPGSERLARKAAVTLSHTLPVLHKRAAGGEAERGPEWLDGKKPVLPSANQIW